MDYYKCQSIVKKLRAFARSIGVQLRIFENNKTLHKQGYVACFNIETRVILVNKKACADNYRFIYTIAHEIGHAMDLDKETPEGLRALSEGWAKYTQIANSGAKVPKLVQEFVLDRELRAFAEGDKILEQIGVQLPAGLRQEAVQENEINYLESFNLCADESY
jgi:hypothetical protein